MAVVVTNDVAGQNPSGTVVKRSKEAERRRRRRKLKKNYKFENRTSAAGDDVDGGHDTDGAATDSDSAKENSDPQIMMPKVEVEYVVETLDCDLGEEFRKIFEKFNSAGSKEEEEKKDEIDGDAPPKKKVDSGDDDDDDDKKEKKEKKNGISNRKKKQQQRMSVAELKQISSRPDVVEVWDTTATDPTLLVYLKSHRNTVPVPRHWSQKRKFLQGKRGIEKPPFQLPHFIAATGIEKIREAYVEKEGNKKLKQKQKDRMQPKMGKMDIDYQVLHDAFFKYQTKPKLTGHGDLYYEGKEFEAKLRDMKPGILSQDLKDALGMPEGAPPPWLINMQRYGPPPSYPDLKIQGLNAPIPPGAKFGYHPGGWGKPPVDGNGRPLYGDVFGVFLVEQRPNYEDEPIDKNKHWGDLEEEEEEEEEEVEEEPEEEEKVDEQVMEDGISSTHTATTGVETPEVIDLRKQQRKEEPAADRVLYQVLEPQRANVDPGTFFGTNYTYPVPGAQDNKTGAKRVDLLKNQKTDKVDVALAPEELDEIERVLPAKYEEAREEEKLRNQREDFSDMVAENSKKRKRKQNEKESKSKKRDFKF
ncbi:OLC1v1035716C1 [Oldenlandia corymbosa var. corymbosa]|uniref:OLC1v1035716C1 n=1 Tax=Oldenlandia corymbosa var. corymbosa TaxID=529605 RepID=A0AAV1CUB6_OLDCO|nr:OLC1v1035716C1 [Oldenlandia corymbosa var. corymbosa]